MDVFNRLSTELSPFFIIFCMFGLAFLVYLYVWMAKLASYCRDAVDFVQNQNKNAVSLRRMAEVEATLTDLLDAYQSLLSSHKKLRSRIGMRKTRADAKANGVDSETPPADEAGRAQYKARLRNDLKTKGML